MGGVSANLAADLGLLLMLLVSGYAAGQVRRGGLDDLMCAGILANLLGVAALWLRVDKPMEGPILLVLGPRHGVTVADLLVVVPVAVAGWLVAGQRSRVRALLTRSEP
ncbi:MAG: hypothetical protein JWL79_867 [Frankiales bacterium]|jgi:hypothetical protein|nr:hypothetical protein [Frankiales bacterium]